MADTRPDAQVALAADLGREDREWLQARLEEYRELLQYLHDH